MILRNLRPVTSSILVGLILASNVSTAMAATVPGTRDYTIVNPYESVDWDSFRQFKANYHSHSNESDGSASPKAMIEEHYAQGFDILAMTDHNFLNTTWDRTDRPATNSSGKSLEYLTSERLAEINSGVGRDGRGMIGVPNSDEQSRSDHLNTFWTDFNNASGATLESNISAAESLDGISHLNHPGRYTGGDTTANNGEDGAFISNDPFVAKKYVDLFTKYNSLVGMEIINKLDGDSYSDRILWDSILKKTMPEQPVWGFSNDDSHSVSAVGFSYNIMLMPENTLENVRSSMENGTFYAVAKVAKRELGINFVAAGPTPVISDIVVDQEEDSIAISGENFEKIQWIADGEVIAEGASIDLDDYEDKVQGYVRAQLIGNGGISFTQPFGVIGSEEKAPELAMAILNASGNSINSDAEEGIQLTLQGVNDNAEYVNLDGATIEYKTEPSDILSVSADGIVTVKNNPVQIQDISVWAELTLDGKTVKSNRVNIQVTLSGQLIARVLNELDDVEEEVNGGSMYMDSSDLEITSDGSTNQIIGTRFDQINIPKGAKIISSYIQFTTDEISSSKNKDPFNVSIHAEKIADSPVFTTDDFNVSTRSLTDNYATWANIPKWLVVGAAGPDQRTPDLTSLVQEVVDLEGWNEGNAITFTFRGTGVRCADAYEDGNAPALYGEYLTIEKQIETSSQKQESLI